LISEYVVIGFLEVKTRPINAKDARVQKSEADDHEQGDLDLEVANWPEIIIERIWVHPECRRKRVATVLLDICLPIVVKTAGNWNLSFSSCDKTISAFKHAYKTISSAHKQLNKV